jgi:hypothetical protein
MLTVKAGRDVYSPGGLLIAKAGTSGVAALNPKPRSATHYGKLLVTFLGRVRSYWCHNDDLTFSNESVLNINLSDYRAQRNEHDPFVDALKFPRLKRDNTFNFGANLRAFRTSRGFSQPELARRMSEIGVNTAQSTISFRENVKDNPGGEFVRAAAEVLAIPPFAFFIDLKKPHGYGKLAKFLQGVSSSVCEE